MIDSKAMKSYMNASRDARFYQTEDYGQVHDLGLRMEELHATIEILPKLMETLMMADIYMNSTDINEDVKVKFKQVREETYNKVAEALIALAG